MTDHRPAKNQRKAKVFANKYGMTRREWIALKKSDPAKAHEKRMKNQ